MASPPPAFLDDALPGEPARLAIFGKHPTAADHLEDIGLASASLVAFKQGFYIGGINECLTRQAWQKDLGAAEAVPYDHSLLCLGRGGWLAARFQHSSDAPGRRQFPLVLALHGTDMDGLNRIAEIGQALDANIAAAAAVKEPAGMQQVHGQAQAQLQELIKGGATFTSPGAAARESWLNGLPLGADHQGLWRICHALSPQGAGAARARVPLHQGGPWQSATLWVSLLRRLIPDQPLTTIVWGPRKTCADVSLSGPGARVLGGLFADESSQPVTSAVPFSYSQEMKEHWDAAFQLWLQSSGLGLAAAAPAASQGSRLLKVCKDVKSWFKRSS